MHQRKRWCHWHNVPVASAKESWQWDSTLIIFTSDNGFMMGEHLLNGKVLALEESIRVPLFLRYPDWFAPNNQSSTIRLLQTLTSLQRFLTFMAFRIRMGFKVSHSGSWEMGEAQRKSFMYEYAGDSLNAAFRAVRTLNSIYIKSYCLKYHWRILQFGNWLSWKLQWNFSILICRSR